MDDTDKLNKEQFMDELNQMRQNTDQSQSPIENRYAGDCTCQKINCFNKLGKGEKERKESEESYRAIFEASGDSIFVIDVKTKEIIDVNAAACKLYGYAREEMIGLKNTDISAEPEKTDEELNKRPARVALRYHKKKNGTIFPVEIAGGYSTLHNRLIHIASIRDISDRIRAEIALQEKEEKFRTIFNQSPIGIELYDHDGKLLDINKACFDIFGVLDIEEVKGFNLFKDPNLPYLMKNKLLSGQAVKYGISF
jgi:PAS domain S-box/PAS domain S-box